MAKKRGLAFGPEAHEPVGWNKRRIKLLGREFGPRHSLEVQAPDFWSEQALQIVARYYFYRVTQPNGKIEFKETSIQSLVDRVVKSISGHGWRAGYFASKADQKNFASQLQQILLRQKGFFNSPVWFNCGLKEAYGAKGSGHLWRYDEQKKTLNSTGNAFESPQVSACFILSVRDELDQVFELAKKEAMIFRYGSGSGVNFSHLRGRNEPVARSGQSHGLLAFLDMLDRGAAALKSGGTSRRSAKMVTLDVDHPDIRDFIHWKEREENKARALIRSGFSGGLDGEAYRSVSGQNANLSVRVSDRFMRAAEKNGFFWLRRRTDGKRAEQVKAGALLREMAEAAWDVADPGLQFADTIEKANTCPHTAKIEASNPCSEYMFVNDSACNLASLNLVAFLDRDGHFSIDDFCHSVRALFVAQDILVGLAGYPTPAVAENSVRLRPLGLGFTNLGGLLMRMAIPYDSPEGRLWASGLSALMMGQALRVSAELAATKGAFLEFKKNRRPFWRVLLTHQKALKRFAANLQKSSDSEELSAIRARAETTFAEAFKMGEKSGFRNSQFTLIAPTGTIGLAMDCDTLGIEPDWALIHKKYLVGGGELSWISKALRPALVKLGYGDQVEPLIEGLKAGRGLKVKSEHQKIFQTASGKSGQSEISPEGHLLMMAAVQPFLSGAISKTINLPTEAKVDLILQIFLRAWQLGLKSVAIYRDQSKVAQPQAEPETGP